MGLGDRGHGLNRHLQVRPDPLDVIKANRVRQPAAGGLMGDLVCVALETVGAHPVGVFSPEAFVEKLLVPLPCCFYTAASILLLLLAAYNCCVYLLLSIAASTLLLYLLLYFAASTLLLFFAASVLLLLDRDIYL